MKVFIEWSGLLGGTALDEFMLINPNELHVRSSIIKASRTVVFTTVYHRKGSMGSDTHPSPLPSEE